MRGEHRALTLVWGSTGRGRPDFMGSPRVCTAATSEGDDRDRRRDIAHAGATCVQESGTLLDVARRMSEPDAGALPVGVDHRLVGMTGEADLAGRLP